MHASCCSSGSLQTTATASHAAAAKEAAAQAQAVAKEAAAAAVPLPDTCHMEQGAEYNGEDVIEWGTDNLKVSLCKQTHVTTRHEALCAKAPSTACCCRTQPCSRVNVCHTSTLVCQTRPGTSLLRQASANHWWLKLEQLQYTSRLGACRGGGGEG